MSVLDKLHQAFQPYMFWRKHPQTLEEAMSIALDILPDWSLERMTITKSNDMDNMILRWLVDPQDEYSRPFHIAIDIHTIRVENITYHFSELPFLRARFWNTLFNFYTIYSIPLDRRISYMPYPRGHR